MNYKYFFIFIPIICIYITGHFFPIKDYNQKKIKFQPPAYVFSIVWPILLLLIGFSWFINNRQTNYYIILTALLSSWIIIYTYSKLFAFINIIIILLFITYIINKTQKYYLKKIKISSLLLIPLFLWLLFAGYLNYNSI